MPMLQCIECQTRLEGNRRKFCSTVCSNKNLRKRKARAAKAVKKRATRDDEVDLALGRNMGRKGETYYRMIELKLAEPLYNGAIPYSVGAEAIGVSVAQVSRLVETYAADMILADRHKQWSMLPAVEYALAIRVERFEDGSEERHIIGPPDDWDGDPDSDLLEDFLDDLVERFVQFRNMFFEVGKGKPYRTEQFHRRWIREILRAIFTGGELQILAPPRHGKTELLNHFAVWLICRNPNIRIMWVSKSKDVAKDSAGAVKDHLEQNEPLIEAVLGPGKQFKPEGRSGKTWSKAEFTVTTRTVVGMKSPTLIAIGRRGAILSKDADLIVCDDIEDHKSTRHPGERESTRTWNTTQLGSRNEEDTALVYIGSRQHMDDLYGHQLNIEDWYHIVDSAHDLSCMLDPDQVKLHTDCMLFPAVRSYKWLRQKFKEAEAVGEANLAEMVYLNRPSSSGIQVFTNELVKECYDHSKIMRKIPYGEGVTHIVAGLDPSATGYQVGFLWAVNGPAQTIQVVDIDNKKGGGVSAVLKLFTEWHDTYKLRHWVAESRGFQKAIIQDERIRDWANRKGVRIDNHETGVEKWDPEWGVTGLVPFMASARLIIPYGDEYSKSRADLYRSQLVNFSQDTLKGRLSDVVMASWFPLERIKLSFRDYAQQDMELTYDAGLDWFMPDPANEVTW